MFTVKTNSADLDTDSLIQIVFDLPSGQNSQAGIAQIVVPSTETEKITSPGKYFYGFKRVIPGTPDDVQTIETGYVKILQPAALINEAHVHVPDVQNMTLTDAQNALQNAGLVSGTVTTESSTTIASGLIIRTDPLSGEYIPVGSTVNLVQAQ